MKRGAINLGEEKISKHCRMPAYTPKTSRFAYGCSSMSFTSMPVLENESASNTSFNIRQTEYMLTGIERQQGFMIVKKSLEWHFFCNLR